MITIKAWTNSQSARSSGITTRRNRPRRSGRKITETGRTPDTSEGLSAGLLLGTVPEAGRRSGQGMGCVT